jgi:GPH family glycoside/pentoside/hexuronide:cation symporter
MIAYASIGIAVIPLMFAQDFTQALVVAFFLGFPVAGLIMMGDVVMADVIDDDESRTGERREGMFYAVNGAATALSSTIVSVGFGIIATMYGYNPLNDIQPASVDFGFRVFMVVLPIMGAICAMTALYFYPLHGQRLADMRAKLAK